MSCHHARQLVVQIRPEVIGIGVLEARGKLADVDLGRVELHRREGLEDGHRLLDRQFAFNEVPGVPVGLHDLDRRAGQLLAEDVQDDVVVAVKTTHQRDHRFGGGFILPPAFEVISAKIGHGSLVVRASLHLSGPPAR